MYFFRAIEDGNPLTFYSLPHIILLIIFILVSYFVIRGKHALLQKNETQLFSKLLAVILLIDQIILYSWQIFSGYFTLEMSLPLYHCRVAVWLLILGVFLQKDKFLIMGMFWGIIGSLSAMIAPDMYQFKFPHYTNFNYFIVHLCMGWLVFHLLFNYKIQISKKDIGHSLIITNLFNVVILTFSLLIRNQYPEVNYGYMIAMPEFLPIHTSLFVHVIIMSIFFNVVTGVIGLIFHQISKKQNTEVEP